ncbi:DUF262 domain-containing protein [Streptomyces corynorhini]|uniref:DUF262 domain-containing protein n=1 Tax=Streptomyces corynorhini TaxID=2282652 RepID=A0A370BAY3_9ACTN|nr:DUF262 domain-containing protein [Streptomyces corynorhini]RDG38950.1 DUF262 domain-containing protein [Streptomyces corynorhini]
MSKQLTFKEDQVGLQEEIVERSREIHTDRYSMAINEALSMYDNSDLEIHPEFQRIFRWGIRQQSRLIESVFLGIPIPPIFVAARKDGVWDVVDGVQRLSTLFRFMGALRRDDGVLDAPDPLTAGDYLKSLEGVVWGEAVTPCEAEGFTVLSEAQRRFFKRARLDFQIVEHTSDEQAKFDLFQRLNSGAHLSEQEARNCLAVMLDPIFYRWLQSLASTPAFEQTVSITERQEEEAYGVELALRYLSVVTAHRSDLSGLSDVGEFLTSRMRHFIESDDFDQDFEYARFMDIFSWLNEALGESSFKRYDVAKSKHSGRFTVSAFEAVTTGLGLNYEQWKQLEDGVRPRLLRQRAQNVWKDETFRSRAGAGKSAELRIPHMFEVGQRVFSLGE